MDKTPFFFLDKIRFLSEFEHLPAVYLFYYKLVSSIVKKTFEFYGTLEEEKK